MRVRVSASVSARVRVTVGEALEHVAHNHHELVASHGGVDPAAVAAVGAARHQLEPGCILVHEGGDAGLWKRNNYTHVRAWV